MTVGVPIDAVIVDAMSVAIGQAREAAVAGEVPVGAVVLHHGQLIVRAQNRMRRDHDATSHAELLAVRGAAAQLGERHLAECTLVVTLEPCAMCAGAIVLSRIHALVFGAWDDKAGMCGSVADIVRHPRLNHRPQVLGGVQQDECARLLTDFFASRRASEVVP